MTPKHQQCIDAVLLKVHERSTLLHAALQPAGEVAHEHENVSVEQLRGSVLGQYLRQIAEYEEGYPQEVVPERQ